MFRKLVPVIALALACVHVTARAGDSKEHFRAECKKKGVIHCAEFGSVKEVVAASQYKQGVPNTPNYPLKNSKCRWVSPGANRDCYPIFEGSCKEKDALLASVGRAQTEDPLRASLWSPCYDEDVDAVRITSWQDLGSSIARQNVGWPTDKNASFDNIWLQYELRIAPGMWRSFQGSYSSKLYRIRREKTGNCRDKRFADGRFLVHSESVIRIGVVTYCGGVDGKRLQVDLPPDMANRWLRITTHFAMGEPRGDFVRLIARDVVSGKILADVTETESRKMGGPLELEPVTPKAWRYLHHSSGRDQVPGAPDEGAHWWVRHNIASREPISP